MMQTSTDNYTAEASSATIDSFIQMLQDLKAQHGGNTPVMFWDQFAVCKFNNINTLVTHDGEHNRIFFGGFHHNADEYYDLINADGYPEFTIAGTAGGD